ncbi:MAG: SDR family NAD(P)-dependent oxidoreductase, partial [Chitinivibrionales bacterium]|nr:SDR family NAD(P)-dependent oxidoreductase [Chitinivibrionales bacterium]
GDEAVHCQGKAILIEKVAAQKLDIKQIANRMDQNKIEPGSVYETFSGLGIQYGPAHRGIQSIRRGDGELLALIELPECVSHTNREYTLHPSIMDSVLQCMICLWNVNGDRMSGPPMPFALDTLTVAARCKDKVYAWVRHSENDSKNRALNKYDFDLCDSDGNICVYIRGFSCRTMEKPSKQMGRSLNAPEKMGMIKAGLHSLIPVWNSYHVTDKPQSPKKPCERILVMTSQAENMHWVNETLPEAAIEPLSDDPDVARITQMVRERNCDHLMWIAPDCSKGGNERQTANNEIVERQSSGVITVLRIVKALINADFGKKELTITCITHKTKSVMHGELIKPAHAGVAGLMGSIAKEYVNWDIRIIDIDPKDSPTALQCIRLQHEKDGLDYAYRNGEWFTANLALVEGPAPTEQLYKQKGVYVVVGGAGGVGEVWTRYMIENFDASIVWIGRRKINQEIKKKINSLAKIGSAPLYISADARDEEELRAECKTIYDTYPVINGVVNSALVLHDQSITRMEEKTFWEVFSSKVNICANIDRVFGELKLDFMLFFSSLMSFSRAAGQSNYAAGCTFKDAFALSKNQARTYPVKVVNWGYWGNIGIVSDDFYHRLMRKNGIGAILPREGMERLQTLVGADIDQMVVLKTLDTQVFSRLHIDEQMHYYAKNGPISMNKISKASADRDEDERFSKLKSGGIPEEMEILAVKILASELFESECILYDHEEGGIKGNLEAISPMYNRWLQTTVDFLTSREINSKAGKEPKKAFDSKRVWSEWKNKKQSWLKNHDVRAYTILLEECLRALSDIICGKVPATDVMFPHSSLRLVEGIYKNNATADYYNSVVGIAISGYISERISNDSTADIHILEVGAGTGGTTAVAIDELQKFENAIAEYCYTDLSLAFLNHAEEYYKPLFPALNTALFDISRPTENQGIASGYFDIAIATNVMHATPDIRKAIRNVKATLKNGGLLLLNEISGWSLFTHATFGLLEGWWAYNDTALRMPGNPGLSAERWQSVLTQEGFGPVIFPAEKAHPFGQQIIAAYSNGAVRRRISFASGGTN